MQAIKLAAEGTKGAVKGEDGPTENGESAAGQEKAVAAEDAMEQEDEEEEEDEAGAAMMPIRGPLPPEEGTWASCVRLLDPVEGATVECLELGEGHRVRSDYPVNSSRADADLLDSTGRLCLFSSQFDLRCSVQLPGIRPNISVWV